MSDVGLRPLAVGRAVLEYPDEAETRGVTCERSPGRLVLHVRPPSFAWSLWVNFITGVGVSILCWSLLGLALTAAAGANLNWEWPLAIGGAVALTMVIAMPILIAAALYESRRRASVSLTDDMLTMHCPGMFGPLEMRWDRRRITRLARNGFGIWVYYGDERRGRITHGNEAQQRWLLRILRDALALAAQ